MPVNKPDKFSEYVDIPIITNMRSGRNYINALSSNLVIACGIDKETISKILLSLVNTAKRQGLVKLTSPEKPNSRKQSYYKE
jgi:hypothetical protein